MTSSLPKRVRWLSPWLRRGFTVEAARSGHFKVRDASGAYVTSVASSPTNRRASQEATEKILRAHKQKESTR